MLSKKELAVCSKILDYCCEICDYINKVSKEEYDNNKTSKIVMCFNIMQIGELVKAFSNEFKEKYNNVNWRLIAGMRDKICHDYDEIDFDRVYYTCLLDIPKLKEYTDYIINNV